MKAAPIVTVQSPRTAWHLWEPPAVSEVLLGPSLHLRGLLWVVVGLKQGYCGQALVLGGAVKEAMVTFLCFRKGVEMGVWE